MSHHDTAAATITAADEKIPGTHEDVEASDEKGAPEDDLNGQTYASQGTNEERALIFKQDLRIIPLCSFIYLLCYLDRSNIGNAKVGNLPTGILGIKTDLRRFSIKKRAMIYSPRQT